MRNVSVLIPSCNFEYLQGCIKSILDWTDLAAYDAEVIVSINGSGIEAVDYVKSLGERFRYTYADHRVGSCTATNLAAKMSDAKYLVRMDEDVLIQDWWWLKRFLEICEDEKVGQVGPWLQHQFGYNTLVGFMYMTRRDLWNKLGGLDVTFEPGCGEDTDYSIKIQRLGYKVVTTNPDGSIFCVFHYSKESWRLGGIDAHARNEPILVERYGPRDVYGETLREDLP